MEPKPEDGIHIVTILGTSRPGSFTAKALALVADELGQQSRVRVTSVDPSRLSCRFRASPVSFPICRHCKARSGTPPEWSWPRPSITGASPQ